MKKKRGVREGAGTVSLVRDIVTGGGPGLMQAANEGAAPAGVRGRSPEGRK